MSTHKGRHFGSPKMYETIVACNRKPTERERERKNKAERVCIDEIVEKLREKDLCKRLRGIRLLEVEYAKVPT